MSDIQLFRQKNGYDFNDGAEIWQQCRIVGAEKDGCPNANLLASWLDGRLNAGERESLELHLLHCEQCMETVVSIRRSLDGKPEKIPYSLRSIYDLVPAADRFFSFAEVMQWLCPLRPGPVIALVGLVLLVATSGYLGSRMAADRLFIHQALVAELSFDFDCSDRAESVGGRSHDAP